MSTLSYSAIMSERSSVGRSSADVSRFRPKFDVQNVSFWYGPQQVLYDVSLTIPERSGMVTETSYRACCGPYQKDRRWTSNLGRERLTSADCRPTLDRSDMMAE